MPRRLDISSENLLKLADGEAALGRLAGAGRLLPDPHLLVRAYLRREAVASSRIEGTQASLLATRRRAIGVTRRASARLR